ncbi:salt stress protein, Slr1339 family [Calothrix sp. PCC 6303]|uniref:salt stress protein, Slr1339 family n=1 Tax=Calothrix sp. PCC 6303 TaxID=1170562 RepID=UPI0002A013F8|nr:hypothetical protein [Calothrix sp. PCC 6303]AFZ02825.1 hypothetical protein Cal6303_3908 [Calothrix sp. PCC 6303]
MDEIDKLLAEIQQEYSQPKPKLPNSNSQTPQNKSASSTPKKSGSNSVDRLLTEVQADFQEKDLAEELQHKQQIEAERIKKEQLKIQQAEVFKKQAEDWLKNLDPLSSEGLWFERFAEQYPSKLEAAVEYLASN